MKTVKPKDFICLKNIAWNKSKHTMHLSVLSSFDLSDEYRQWQSEDKLFEIVKKISSSYVLDNLTARKNSECLVYAKKEQLEQKFELKMNDIHKVAKRSEFLPLLPEDKYYKQTKGTFDDEWLNDLYPAYPKDATDEAYQTAAKNQQCKENWQYGKESFVINHNDSAKEVFLPMRKMQAFAIQSDEFLQIDMKPDVLWILPEDNCALLICHGFIDVSDQEASDVTHLYVIDNDIDENIELAQHRLNLEEELSSKKPKLEITPQDAKEPSKPKVSIPSVEVPAEAKDAMASAEAKLAEMSGKYGFDTNVTKTPIPAEIQQAIDGGDTNNIMSKVSEYVTAQMANMNQSVANIAPNDTARLNVPQTFDMSSVKESLQGSIAKLKELMADNSDNLSELPNVPDDLPEEMTATVLAMLGEQDAKDKKKAQRNYVEKDCSNQDFEDYDFTDCDLTKADFSGANLKGAIFDRTKLIGTIFAGADLTGAKFENVNIDALNFDDAILDNSSFKNLAMKATSLKKIACENLVIENIRANDVELTETKLVAAVIKKSTFSKSNLCSLKFEKSHLDGVMFKESQLSEIELLGCELTKITNIQTTWGDVSLLDGKYEKLSFNSSKLVNSSLANIKLTDLAFSNNSTCENVGFSNSKLIGFRMNKSQLTECDFEMTNMNESKFVESQISLNKFVSTELNKSMFYKCEFSQQEFSKVVAKETSFSSSKMSGMLFEYSNLLDANFAMTSLIGTIFKSSNLYDVNLYQANTMGTIFDNNLTANNFDIIKGAQTLKVTSNGSGD
mgnify:CR=1 FL=1